MDPLNIAHGKNTTHADLMILYITIYAGIRNCLIPCHVGLCQLADWSSTSMYPALFGLITQTQELSGPLILSFCSSSCLLVKLRLLRFGLVYLIQIDKMLSLLL